MKTLSGRWDRSWENDGITETSSFAYNKRKKTLKEKIIKEGETDVPLKVGKAG